MRKETHLRAGAVLSNVDLADSNWWKARGLTAEQLDYFEQEFPPSDEADETIRLDFEVWREAREGGGS